ncbi:MAG: ester cyclase [Chloroflexi bacterium]|nr:ester cyclase [Chloroflexota bacterium]
MSIEETRKVFEAFRAASNERWPDVEAYVSLFSDEAALKAYGGRETMREGELAWRGAFPDWRMEFTHVVVGEDSVAFVARATATHTGPLMGNPPTNRAVEFEGTGFLTVANGLVTDAYYPGQEATVASIFSQLGLPMPGPA